MRLTDYEALSAKVIDINSGVCTVGYASHEQLKKLELKKDDLLDNQSITDALEGVLQQQPDHQTWVTQDVFALSIVVMEWLTFGMFTYPYNRDQSAPSYVQLLMFELQVYDLLLSELSDVYDVSVAWLHSALLCRVAFCDIVGVGVGAQLCQDTCPRPKAPNHLPITGTQADVADTERHTRS